MHPKESLSPPHARHHPALILSAQQWGGFADCAVLVYRGRATPQAVNQRQSEGWNTNLLFSFSNTSERLLERGRKSEPAGLQGLRKQGIGAKKGPLELRGGKDDFFFFI